MARKAKDQDRMMQSGEKYEVAKYLKSPKIELRSYAIPPAMRGYKLEDILRLKDLGRAKKMIVKGEDREI